MLFVAATAVGPVSIKGCGVSHFLRRVFLRKGGVTLPCIGLLVVRGDVMCELLRRDKTAKIEEYKFERNVNFPERTGLSARSVQRKARTNLTRVARLAITTGFRSGRDVFDQCHVDVRPPADANTMTASLYSISSNALDNTKARSAQKPKTNNRVAYMATGPVAVVTFIPSSAL